MKKLLALDDDKSEAIVDLVMHVGDTTDFVAGMDLKAERIRDSVAVPF